MHRIKKLLAAGGAAVAVTGGAIALAGPANAATPLSVTFSASPDASASLNAAGDVLLKVGSSSSTFAEMSINGTSAVPGSAPTFATDNYSSGSPRFFIKLSGGDGLIGLPSNAGDGASNWQVTSPASGDCHVGSSFVDYATALKSIPSGCAGTVSSAGIIADSGQATGTTDTITNISYAGMTLADVVTVTSPGNQTNTVGTAITTLTLKASSNTGSAITAFAATGLPAGLSIDTAKGTITGTPTTAGTSTVKVTATDAAGTTSAAVSFTWTINTSGPTAIFTGPIHLVRMGLCLDDRLNSKASGAVVQVWRCNGESTQVWQVMNNGTIEHNGLCLDARGFGTTSGTKVQLWACTGGANQKWDASRGFRIRYANPSAANEVLDDTAFGGSGTQQEIFTNNGGANQIWATF